MVYEWDAKRARRAHLARMGLNVLAALMAVAVPAWVVVVLEIV